MITVSQLKNACEVIEREWGADSKIVLQIRNEDGSLKDGDYCIDIFRGADGTLFLTNHKFKHGNCE